MSPLTKKEAPAKEKMNIKSFILPLYIILSLIFIVYMGYSYAVGFMYQSGLNSGQQQWQQVGYKVGYEDAIAQLIGQAGTQCEPVSISLGDAGVNVINVACLQVAPQNQASAPQE